jgi:hypothetical protein
MEIREYYGEKISLYFTYLGYYTKMLLPISILGLITNIFQIYIWDTSDFYYILSALIFGFIHVNYLSQNILRYNGAI